MGLFNRKRRQPQPNAQQAARPTRPEPTLPPGRSVEVVGESHYQDALEAICGRKCSQGYELAVLAELRRSRLLTGVGTRAPMPGELCTCGRPAVTVYVVERFGAVG